MGRCNEDGSGEEGAGGGQGTGREWEGKVSRGIGGEMENGEEIGREQGSFRRLSQRRLKIDLIYKELRSDD